MYEQTNLWESLERLENTKKQHRLLFKTLDMADADIIFYPYLFSQPESDYFFVELSKNINWKQESIMIYGKPVPIPRLTAWYGDGGKSYSYSKIAMNPEPWTHTLLKIKSEIESITGVNFNSVLLNLYRDGSDSVAWHSDDEPELGTNPVIASVSFSGTRRFVFKHKYKKELNKIEINLTHGSFLIMKGTTQHLWQHQVPKTTKSVQPRINLTFRLIV